MDKIRDRIIEEVRPIYNNSPHYTLTIWRHVSRVAQHAKELAMKMDANQFIAEVGGFLHDVGAAKYGKENHHITGVQEASCILLKCECPTHLIGPILSSIYSHRGSERMVFQVPEAKCVAAADALEHFQNLEELWRVFVEDRKTLELEVYQVISAKLKRDWEKIDPQLKAFINESYDLACKELLEIASRKLS